MTTPFEAARGVANNVSGAFKRREERSAIDQILEQASATNDPAQIDFAMRQILKNVAPERQGVAMGILQNKQAQIKAQMDKEREAEAYKQAGLNPSAALLPPGVQSQMIKGKEDAGDSKGALETIARMREIQGTGHLGGKVNIVGTGRKYGSTLSSEGQRLRSEYERLGKSLIQQSTNIPIRNKQEFEILAHDLYDATRSNEEILGTLDAMEKIIKFASEQTGKQPSNQDAKKETQNKRPPLDSFYR